MHWVWHIVYMGKYKDYLRLRYKTSILNRFINFLKKYQSCAVPQKYIYLASTKTHSVRIDHMPPRIHFFGEENIKELEGTHCRANKLQYVKVFCMCFSLTVSFIIRELCRQCVSLMLLNMAKWLFININQSVHNKIHLYLMKRVYLSIVKLKVTSQLT
jgi:hypothetical protein